jgi:hypothetical protein
MNIAYVDIPGQEDLRPMTLEVGEPQIGDKIKLTITPQGGKVYLMEIVGREWHPHNEAFALHLKVKLPTE